MSQCQTGFQPEYLIQSPDYTFCNVIYGDFKWKYLLNSWKNSHKKNERNVINYNRELKQICEYFQLTEMSTSPIIWTTACNKSPNFLA